MHEQSLVKNLLRQVDQIRRQNNAQRVVEVHVEIGPMSGVEPLLVSSAFDQLCDDDMAETRLVIDEIDLLAECSKCKETFEVRDFCFRCPTCSGNVKVIQGDEFQLVSVSLENDQLSEEGVA